jgi:hypothetical protein
MSSNNIKCNTTLNAKNSVLLEDDDPQYCGLDVKVSTVQCLNKIKS